MNKHHSNEKDGCMYILSECIVGSQAKTIEKRCQENNPMTNTSTLGMRLPNDIKL